MSKFFISLALVAAQVLPYAGGPWFACVSRDGSLCVDRGPQACCCLMNESQHQAACSDDHEATGEVDAHSHAVGSAESHCSPTPCDCTHELVNQKPTTVTRDAPFAVDLHVQIWAVAALDQATASSLTAVLGVACAGAGNHSALSQGLHNSVVLRC
jgi:hypothetical protein